MKTIRVFTVEVSGCNNCPHMHLPLFMCTAPNQQSQSPKAFSGLRDQNKDAITPSCPRYAETKLIEVKE